MNREQRRIESKKSAQKAALAKAKENGDLKKPELPHIVTLKHPLKLGNQVINELKFEHDITVAVMEEIPISELEYINSGDLLTVVSCMTGKPVEVLKTMHWASDWQICMGVAISFLFDGQENGSDG